MEVVLRRLEVLETFEKSTKEIERRINNLDKNILAVAKVSANVESNYVKRHHVWMRPLYLYKTVCLSIYLLVGTSVCPSVYLESLGENCKIYCKIK